MGAIPLVGPLGVAFRRKAPERDLAQPPIRSGLLRLIETQRGINEKCIQQETGLSRSTVRHHLRMLVAAGVLRKFPVGRENHYFPSGTNPRDMKHFAMANHGRAKAILREILLDPGIPQWELAQRLGMTRKILRHHLDFLVKEELILEWREDRFQRYSPGQGMDSALRGQLLISPCLPPPSRERPGNPPKSRG